MKAGDSHHRITRAIRTLVIAALAAAPQALAQPTNDNFAAAVELNGSVIYAAAQSVVGATMEPGEPLHLGPSPQKSIWWRLRSPVHGSFRITRDPSDPNSMVIPNILIAVYQGDRVETLTLIGKATNSVVVNVVNSEVYSIAVVVPADVPGETPLFCQATAALTTPILSVPNNLLREPSWENTAVFNAVHWKFSGHISALVNQSRGIDGLTWPILYPESRIWQTIATIPGHDYRIRFAHRASGNWRNPTECRVLWDGALAGIASGPADTLFWSWTEYIVRASNTTTQLMFENLVRGIEMDSFSVVDISIPPIVRRQPASTTVVSGGTAAFTVSADGAPPLRYQWYHENSPLPEATNHILILSQITPLQAGGYTVTITNSLGSVTSATATLNVDTSSTATIVVQPAGGVFPSGSYVVVNVIATGAGPMDYQWSYNGDPLASATNRSLVFTNFQEADAGRYEVLVQNFYNSVRSLPAELVATNMTGGGHISFRNGRYPLIDPLVNALIYDVDGVTPLSGPAYVAQLYSGNEIENLRPVGEPRPFREGSGAGYFLQSRLVLPHAPPNTSTYAQVRVWEQSFGVSYEEARALGGKFGRSSILTVTPSTANEANPAPLVGLTSFNLQAGLLGYTTGLLSFQRLLPDGQSEWTLQGEAGFRYLVEAGSSPQKTSWRPYLLLTNDTGTVTFTVEPGPQQLFLRSRILD